MVPFSAQPPGAAGLLLPTPDAPSRSPPLDGGDWDIFSDDLSPQPAASNHDGMPPLGYLQRSFTSATKRENTRWQAEHTANIEREKRAQQQSAHERETMLRSMVATQLVAAAGSTPSAAMLQTIQIVVGGASASSLQLEAAQSAAAPPAAAVPPLPPAGAAAAPQITQSEGADEPAAPLAMAAIPGLIADLQSRESAVALLARVTQERENTVTLSVPAAFQERKEAKIAGLEQHEAELAAIIGLF